MPPNTISFFDVIQFLNRPHIVMLSVIVLIWFNIVSLAPYILIRHHIACASITSMSTSSWVSSVATKCVLVYANAFPKARSSLNVLFPFKLSAHNLINNSSLYYTYIFFNVKNSLECDVTYGTCTWYKGNVMRSELILTVIASTLSEAYCAGDMYLNI